MVLSDRSIREELASGRLRIEPLSDDALQPSSVDLRLDRLFRVFKKTDRPHIDVREPCDDCTELITVDDDKPFVIQPGRVRPREHAGDDHPARRPRGPPRRPQLAGAAGPARARDGRLRRPRLERQADAGAVERLADAHRRLLRHEDLPDIVPAPVDAGDRPYGSPGLGSKYQGQQEPTPSRAYQDFKDDREYPRYAIDVSLR